MLKKILTWGGIAFLIFFIAFRPKSPPTSSRTSAAASWMSPRALATSSRASSPRRRRHLWTDRPHRHPTLTSPIATAGRATARPATPDPGYSDGPAYSPSAGYAEGAGFGDSADYAHGETAAGSAGRRLHRDRHLRRGPCRSAGRRVRPAAGPAPGAAARRRADPAGLPLPVPDRALPRRVEAALDPPEHAAPRDHPGHVRARLPVRLPVPAGGHRHDHGRDPGLGGHFRAGSPGRSATGISTASS